MSFPVYHINELRVLIALLLVMHLQRWGKLVYAKFLYFKVTIFPFSVDKFFGEDNLKLCKSLFSSNFCALIWHLLVVLICHFMLLLLKIKSHRDSYQAWTYWLNLNPASKRCLHNPTSVSPSAFFSGDNLAYKRERWPLLVVSRLRSWHPVPSLHGK